MDISSTEYISDLEGMEELNLIHQCHMDSIGGFTSQTMVSTPASTGLHFRSSSQNTIPSSTYDHNESEHLHSYIKPKDEIVSSGNFQLPPLVNYKRPHSHTHTSSTSTSTTPHAQDHILAERKRREKLSQRFIALSAILPGLKKMDKASILGDGIKYLRQLRERVRVLEDQTNKRNVESVVFVKRSKLVIDNHDDEDENDDKFSDNKALPEIEVKVSDIDVLIRIHCETKNGTLVKILHEIEKLHLSIVNSTALPFRDCTLDITIVATKDDEFDMTTMDLARFMVDLSFTTVLQLEGQADSEASKHII
ncbi:hypothetical protein ACFE04_022656 [Oxalis oulophora]